MNNPRSFFLISAALVIFLFIGYTLLVYMAFSSVSKGISVSGNSVDNPALLVIDVQEWSTGIYSTSENHKAQSSDLIKNLNRAILLADSVNIPVIYIKQYHKHWLFKLVSGSNLYRNAPGTELDNRLKTITPHIFLKYKMDAFSNPDFEQFLLNRNINHLYVTGLDAAYCVDRTSRAALLRNYRVTVIPELLISENRDLKLKSLKKFSELGIEILSLPEFLKTMKSDEDQKLDG